MQVRCNWPGSGSKCWSAVTVLKDLHYSLEAESMTK